MKFRIGDKVVKNPATWLPSDFDQWGAGEGIGTVDAIFTDGDNVCVDVRWPAGRCYQYERELEIAKNINY